jgi:hypothetical protein
MRIPLAPSPNRVGRLKSSEPTAQDIRESWQTWVASKCPREPLQEVVPRGTPAPFGFHAGHAIPKPYTPPPED